MIYIYMYIDKSCTVNDMCSQYMHPIYQSTRCSARISVLSAGTRMGPIGGMDGGHSPMLPGDLKWVVENHTNYTTAMNVFFPHSYVNGIVYHHTAVIRFIIPAIPQSTLYTSSKLLVMAKPVEAPSHQNRKNMGHSSENKTPKSR